MCLFMLETTSFFKMFMKNRYGFFSFDDTTLYLHDGKIEKILPKWNLKKEQKHRIWHAFWNSTLLNLCDEKTAERFLQLEYLTQQFGLVKIKQHFVTDEKILGNHIYI